MAIEYLTGLNAIVMKAIWNIEKRQGRVTIQDLVEEIKRNTGKEYHRNSVSTYLRRLEKKDFIETKKEGRRSFIYSKVDESDYHKVQFEQMKKMMNETGMSGLAERRSTFQCQNPPDCVATVSLRLRVPVTITRLTTTSSMGIS